MEKLRMGIVGLGFIGARYIKILAEEPCAELIAVYDLDERLTSRLAAQYECACCKRSLELFSRLDIDAVVICVPESEHHAIAIAAAKAGKHILLEKPIAKTVAEAIEIKAACEKNGVRLMIAQTLLFDSRYIQLHERVKQGELGEISYIFARRQNSARVARRFQGKVSFLYYLGVHDIVWMLLYANSPPKKIYAQINDVINRDVGDQDSAFVTINFENGVIGSLCVNWSLPENSAITLISDMEVVGSKGMGVIRVRDHGLEITTNTDIFRPDCMNWPEVDNIIIDGVLKKGFEHFVRSTVNKRSYLVDTDIAIRAVSVIEAALESADIGLPVMCADI